MIILSQMKKEILVSFEYSYFSYQFFKINWGKLSANKKYNSVFKLFLFLLYPIRGSHVVHVLTFEDCIVYLVSLRQFFVVFKI